MSDNLKVFLIAVVCFGFAGVFAWALIRDLATGVAVFRGSSDTRKDQPFGYWFTIACICVPLCVFSFLGCFCVYAIFQPN